MSARADERQVYFLRPNNTSLWLPASLARSIGLACRGQTLSNSQFSNARLQELLARRQSRCKAGEALV